MADLKDNKDNKDNKEKKTTVICINKANLTKLGYANLEEWLKNPNHVYIGRHMQYVRGAVQSKWANKFTVQKYGRNRCLELYKEEAQKKFSAADLQELHGKVLGCWCKPEPCHGDVLIGLLNTTTEKI